MKMHIHFKIIMSQAIVSLLFVASVSAQSLSGRVYQGNKGTEPPTATPLSGVTVSLYESNDPNSLGTYIRSTTTNSSGWYSLETEGGQQYYFIVETDPGTHYSVGATSVSGTVVNNNRIRYTAPLSGKELTGNKFWDKLKVPEMDVQGNSISIGDGDASPSTTDGTDFGSVAVSGDSIAHTFTIKNMGSASLNLTGSPRVVIGGTHASDFSVILQPSTPLASGGSTTFRVLFNPSASGVRSATVSIANNDANENPYNFSIQGTGTTPPAAAPEMDVQGNSISIADGDATPSTTDGTDFGSVAVSGDSTSHTFTIKNTGTAYLSLTGSPRVVIGGTHASDFYTYTQPDSFLSSGGSTTFRVLFNPSASGVRSATISIANNDANENPYNFSIQGTGTDGAGTGTIIVEKQTIPDGAPDLFTFTGDAAGAISDSGRIVVSGLTPGSYTSQETVPSGWTLTSITFDDSNSTADLQTATATFQLEAGETVKAVFTNTKTDTTEYEYDFGDAPDPTYPTLLSSDGARHIIDPDVFLGSSVESDPDGQPSSNAQGDDADGSDDEDGVVFTSPLVPGTVASVKVTASVQGLLYGWIDFQQDGQFDVATDHVFTGQVLSPGLNVLGMAIPANAMLGFTYARFRFSQNSVLDPDGLAPDGEVEDYLVEVTGVESGSVTVIKEADPQDDTEFLICVDYAPGGFFSTLCQKLSDPSNDQWVLLNPYNLQSVYESPTPGWTLSDIQVTGDTDNGSVINLSSYSVTVDFDPGEDIVITFKNEKDGGEGYDFGDAPSTYGSAFHQIIPNMHFGALVDAENTPLYSLTANGDDDNVSDDEDGVTFPEDFVPGHPSEVIITFKDPNIFVDVAFWIDFDRDSVFKNPSERFWCSFPMSNVSSLNYFFQVPEWAKLGKTFARFRLYKFSGGLDPSPTGFGGEGEVEDYEIEIKSEGDVPPEGAIVSGMKWNDLNGNGMRDLGEPGLANWIIWIDLNGNGMNDPGESTLTDMNGQFFFFGLQPGTYTVYEELQSGWTQTYPGGPGTHTVSVTAEQTLTGLLFGNKEEGSGDFGAVKWSQPPLFGEIPERDTTCFWGWSEPSMQLMHIAADDWFCYDPRPVTAIRWWGGYADWDTLTAPPNAPTQFHIGVWTDVPRGEDQEWSHPRELIHEWVVERSSVNETPMRCMSYPEVLDTSITGFEYLFQIPQEEWFQQEGDSTIYWLSISAVYETEVDSYHWGWLTREHYFHDDATRMHFEEPIHVGSVFEAGEPIGERWDMAFELSTDEYQRVFDYGDAPETDYATRFERNGAHHRISHGIFMGGTVDQDSDGQPNIGALGDDGDGQDDEDGVEFAGALTIGEVNEVTVRVSSLGFLSAWLDFDRDGNWFQTQDLIIPNVLLDPGLHTIQFDVMEEVQAGETVARFRFSTEPDVWFNGFAMNGEVEDYVVNLQEGTAVEVEQSGLPSECMLYSNYPNPFNPSTNITYALPRRASVTLEIYNIRGAKVITLVDGIKEPGSHTIIWDGKDSSGVPVVSGLYLCRMKTSGFQKTVRMLFLK